jgi:hypothetical protein
MNNNLLSSVMRVKKNADKLKGGLLKLAHKLEGGFRKKKKTKNLKGGKKQRKSLKKSIYKKTEETIRDHYRRRYG